MRYDASTTAHQALRRTLSLEPRVIRQAHVKLGDGKLESLSKYGKPEWRPHGADMVG